MNTKNIKLNKVIPVFLTFFVMGFVDLVGVSTGYVQKDFELSDSLAQFIPSMVFVWFFVFSIPIGILQDKIGKKKMMTIGIVVTLFGLLLPFLIYTFPMILVAFVFIGVGNTIIQVSVNPLLQEVIPEKKLPSFLSLSQFAKAIISLLGPVIATFMAIQYGDWKIVFIVYALVTLITLIYLNVTSIEETIKSDFSATFASCLSLLKNKFVIVIVMSIFLIVGADVGMNSNIQGILMKMHGFSLEEASYGISIYFTALMISRFSGSILLQFLKPLFFLVTTTSLAVLGTSLLLISSSGLMAMIAIFVIGLGAGNLFPLVFSIAINRMPSRANEISGLLIMALVGGAIIPPIMGIVSSTFNISASIFILLLCFMFIFILPLIKDR